MACSRVNVTFHTFFSPYAETRVRYEAFDTVYHGTQQSGQRIIKVSRAKPRIFPQLLITKALDLCTKMAPTIHKCDACSAALLPRDSRLSITL